MEIKELLYDIQKEKEYKKQEELIETFVYKQLADQAIRIDAANAYIERKKYGRYYTAQPKEEIPDTWIAFQEYFNRDEDLNNLYLYEIRDRNKEHKEIQSSFSPNICKLLGIGR